MTGHRLDGGLPLGGLGTGYFTLEGSGLIGHCSIFNDIVPPRADFSEWLTVKIAGGESLPLSNADIAYWGTLSGGRYGLPICAAGTGAGHPRLRPR